ncbi:MAG: hypothetical protein COT84_00080 [Chlamydiae bacterium CG10_big_fil_rev_8_21_14_0_10_35_9]|nr:MAG: hypothetical protein COT84_00080 [Chlamydiae bacterium CG10_big_fil_rev_8_21_14_0_10_35_9]
MSVNLLKTQPFYAANVQELHCHATTSILKYLNIRETLDFAATSSSTLDLTKRSINIIKPSEVRHFIDNLILVLDAEKHTKQIENLNKIKEEFYTSDLSKLYLLKYRIFDVKRSILKELLTLDDSVRSEFAQVPPPCFFKSFFGVLGVYKSFNKIGINPTISRELVKEGKLDKTQLDVVLKAVCLISDYQHQKFAFKEYIGILIEKEEFDSAIKAASYAREHLSGSGLGGSLEGEYALQKISYCFFREGNLDKSAEVAVSIRNTAIRGFTLRGISIELFKRKEMDKGIEVIGLHTEECTRNHTFKDVVENFLKESNMHIAFEVAKLIPDERTQTEALIDTYQACLECKHVPLALTVIKAIPNELVRTRAICNVALFYSKEDEFEKALEMADQALNDAKLLQKGRGKSNILGNIAGTFVEIGYLNKALEVAKLIEDRVPKVHALRGVFHAFLKGEDFSAAFETIKLIADEGPSIDALRAYVEAFLEVKDLQHAFETAKFIPDTFPRISAFVDIARAFVKAGDSNAAIEILNQAFEMVLPFYDEDTRSHFLYRISLAFVLAGDLNSALKVAEFISDNEKKSDALIDIAKGFFKLGNQDKASETLSQAANVAQGISWEIKKEMTLEKIFQIIQSWELEVALQVLEGSELGASI